MRAKPVRVLCSCLALWAVPIGCASEARGARTRTGADAANATSPAARAAARTRFVSPFSYEQVVRAELLSARGDYAGAARAYDAALAAGDDDPYLMAQLADALDRAGAAKDAQSVLSDALELDPRSEAAWLARARIHARRGRVAEAWLAYQAAAHAEPESARAQLELAEWLTQLGHVERARAVLERLVHARPRDARARLRARLRLSVLSGEAVALVAAARDWLALGELDPALEHSAAQALVACKRPWLALRLLERRKPSADDAALRLALLLELGHAAAARQLLSELPPAWLGGPQAMARSYLALGDPAAAYALSLEADASHERDPLLEAQALLLLGRTADASEALAATLSAPSQAIGAQTSRERSRRLLRGALSASGLPALGRELDAEPSRATSAADQ